MSKLYLALFSLTFLFLFSSCKDEVNPLLTNSTGKLKMSIDKANAPTNVFFVKATLTKENCNEVDATLNLKSDTTADITIDNLDAGQWHLKVEAFDSLMSLKYSGEADVTITEDYLTQINLTLSPVGSGKGSILISVSWGSSTTSLITDFKYNPILTTLNVPGTPTAIGQNVVIYENGKYKIWFNNIYSGPTGAIYYGESNDGINWSFPSSSPVLAPTPGAWDSQFSLLGTIFKDGAIYRMYYAGKSTNSEQISLGTATSTDGINWIKQINPLTISGIVATSIGAHTVMKFNNKYYLYYSLKNNGDVLGYATSTDGINFQNQQSLVFTNNSWLKSNITGIYIINENGLLKAIFPTRNEDMIGYATSTDGINWQVDEKFAFNKMMGSNHWFETLTYPSFVKTDNGYRVYYIGYIPHGTGWESYLTSALGFFTFNK